MSIETTVFWSAEAFRSAEGNTGGLAMVRGRRAPRCPRPHARMKAFLSGPGRSLVCPDNQGRCGKEKTVAADVRAREVRLGSYCTDEAGRTKGSDSLAELVEGRAGANGRLRSQSTCRTQRRESVIQEAPRPRRRASRRNASKVRRSSDRRQEPCALARLHGVCAGGAG